MAALRPPIALYWEGRDRNVTFHPTAQRILSSLIVETHSTHWLKSRTCRSIKEDTGIEPNSAKSAPVSTRAVEPSTLIFQDLLPTKLARARSPSSPQAGRIVRDLRALASEGEGICMF